MIALIQKKNIVENNLKTRAIGAKTLLLLLLLGLLMPLAHAQQNTLTVYDGTSTNNYVPLYGNWADAYLKCEFVVPADELSEMNGGTISQMDFYLFSPAAAAWTGTFQVFLKEVQETTLSAWSGTDDATIVFTGNLDGTGSTMTVAFSNNYTYGGGNLLVGVYQTTKGNYKSASFTGTNVTGASGSNYNSSSLDGVTFTQRNFIPKTTFTYTPGGGLIIYRPTNLAVALTPGDGTVATLSWTENNENATGWQICLNDDENNLVEATENPYQLTGLTPETPYSAKVRSITPDGMSNWSTPVSFTPTDTYTLTVNDGNNTNGFVPVYGYYVDGISLSQFIIPAPELENMAYGTITKMTFYASQSSVGWNNAQFEAYMVEVDYTTFTSDTPDWTGMEMVMNEAHLQISDNKMVVTLDAPYQYMDGNLMIGIKETVSGAYGTSTWYGVNQQDNTAIGNISYSGNTYELKQFLPKTTFEYIPGEAPACLKPKSLTASDVTAHEATITWTSDASVWEIQLGEEEAIEVTEATYTFTDLTPETTYSVKVRANCGDDGYSDWTTPVSFTTDIACPAPTGQTASDVTNHEATLSWTGTSESYTVEYRTVMPFKGSKVGDDWESITTGDTTVTLTNLYSETEYEYRIQGYCGVDGYSSWVYGSFTTTIACPAPTNLTCTGVTGTTATLSWTETGGASAWQIMLNDDEGNLIDADTNPFTLTDLTPETIYTAKVKALCGDDDGESLWSNTVSFEPTNKILIGTGTTTSSNIPSYVNFCYSLTQQIYTADEIGQACEILSIDFYMQNSSDVTRNLNIYMVNTEKETFSSNTDWVAVTADDLVFSGDVTFTRNDWTTIEFENSFSYDGVSNVVIVVDDNTGSYVNSPGFYVFSATNQTLRTHSDNTNPNPETINSSGIVASMKNRIRLAISDPIMCPKPTDVTAFGVTSSQATITWTSDASAWEIQLGDEAAIEVTEATYTFTGLASETTYSVKVRANCGDDGYSKWTAPVSFTTAEGCPEGMVCIGAGTANDIHLPAYTDTRYSLTQQIYTVDEIGPACEIQSIEFYTESNVTRNLDIYMVSTEKETFSSDTDWITVTADNLVFSGDVTFTRNDWTTIEFENSFSYDGVRNVAVIVDDNTGTLYGQANFRIYFSATDQAIYNENYYTNFDPESINTSGNTTNKKNRIRFTVTDLLACPKPTGVTVSGVSGHKATITWTSDAAAWQVQLDEEDPIDVTNTTAYTFNSLTPETTYNVKVRANCGDDGYSDWVYRSFTTTVPCPTPTNLACTETTSTTATLSWTEAGDASAWQIMIDNDEENLIDVDTNPFTLTDLTLETVYTAKVRAVCGGDDGESLWSDALSFEPTYKTIIGSGADTCHYLPTNAFYRYSLTQQIYTAEELRRPSGFIESIDFYAKAQRTRTIDIYMVNTDKETFENGDDWVTTTESDLVFSGEVTFLENAWTTITFDNSFRYDGQSNVVLAVDDYTGSYASRMYFKTFDAPSQTLYIYSDNRRSSGIADMKNQIRIMKNVPSYTKQIIGYGQSAGGYHLIASPTDNINPTEVDGMTLTGNEAVNYDLYYFDQSEVGQEWRNYKVENFNLLSGKGYLYANKYDDTLTFYGVPYIGDGAVALDYDTIGDLVGWNLIGNPFTETAHVDRGFYTMNSDGSEIVAATSGTVEAMEGIFVVAATEGDTVTFSTTDPDHAKGAMLSLNLSQGRGTIDRAIVRFGEGGLLPKFQLNPSHTKVYIPQDGKDYAIVNATDMGEMPVNFKAEENGTYTMNFSSEEVDFDYRHLIDNMTGADVDLLQTPSYTFNAKTTDYANRFKLVFATGNNSNDDNFAFFNNGNLIISNEGEATLQVVDVMGRILKSERINGSASINVNAAAGVYMIRLINGNNVKVQKIVVK